jgi:hypothetical protein
VTEAVTVHVPPLGGIVPPLKAIVLLPEFAVVVPPQVVATLLGEATTSPPGRLSVNAAPVAAAVPVLPSVIVIVDAPLTVIDDGENVLLTVTAACAADAALRTRSARRHRPITPARLRKRRCAALVAVAMRDFSLAWMCCPCDSGVLSAFVRDRSAALTVRSFMISPGEFRTHESAAAFFATARAPIALQRVSPLTQTADYVSERRAGCSRGRIALIQNSIV